MMESEDAGMHLLKSSEADTGALWDAAAKYRELLQQQHQRLARERLEEDNASSDGGSSGHSPADGSEGMVDDGSDDIPSDKDSSLLSLKHKTAAVESDFRIRSDLHSTPAAAAAAAALAALQRHPFSPQQLLAAATMRHHPASMVAQPGLDFRAPPFKHETTSPPASPPRSLLAAQVECHSPLQRTSDTTNVSPAPAASGQSPKSGGGSNAPWNYEEQFKQLYEIDDNPKRKEFLDELFQFMQNRGTPINRLPIMAKQVLDLFELFNLVVARGGLVEVINKKLWQEIIKGLKLPSSITSAAFTLRTQYMKYLYPQECNKINLSSPAELQAAIDGNRREGRRSNYAGGGGGGGAAGGCGSYADLVQGSPFLHMPPAFGMANGLASSLHHQQQQAAAAAMTPLSLATSRANHLAAAAAAAASHASHQMPSNTPFLPGLGAPLLPSANDTLLTLWSMYNKHQSLSSQQQQSAAIPQIPTPPVKLGPLSASGNLPSAADHHQSEALNLGVRRETASSVSDSQRSCMDQWESRDSMDGEDDRVSSPSGVVLATKRSLDLTSDEQQMDEEKGGEAETSEEHDHNPPANVWSGEDSVHQPSAKIPRTSPLSSDPAAKSDSQKSHTKMKIDSKDDGSLVVSMEIQGLVYEGVLFAQSRSSAIQ